MRREGRTQRPMSKRNLDSYSSEDDYDPCEYGDPRMKPRENDIVKSLKRSPRQSAQEAVKKMKRNFAVPSGDQDDEWSEISHLFTIPIKNSLIQFSTFVNN